MIKLAFKLTTACNFQCSYCYLRSSSSKKQLIESSQRINLDTCKKSLELVQENFPEENIHIIFFGGEPLIEWGIIQEWLKFIKKTPRKHKISHSITTNGSLLSEDKIGSLFDNNVSVNISLDDISKRENIFGLIKRITNEEEKQQKHLLSVRVAISDCRANLLEIYEKLKSLNVKKIHILPITKEGYNYSLFIENYKNIAALVKDEILYERKIRNAQIGFILKIIYQDEIRETFCDIGEKYLAVNTDGKIFPCTGFLDLKNFLMGDIYLDRPEKILKNIKSFTPKTQLQNKPSCTSCWMKHICAGNCLHASYLLTGSCSKVMSEGECSFMKYLGDFSLELYCELIKRDELLLQEVLLGSSFWNGRIVSAKDIHVGKNYLYKPQAKTHEIFEIDEIQKELFRYIATSKSTKEAYDHLKKTFNGDEIQEESFIETINTYLEKDIIACE